MEIKYDMTNNYWNCHNEAQAIVMMKRKLKKNPNRKIRDLFTSSMIYGILTICFILITFLLSKLEVSELYITMLTDLCFLLILFLGLYFLLIFVTYAINKRKASHKGILLINEKGLTDTSDSGVITDIPWEEISFIAIKKYTVTFVTTTSLVVFVNSENKKDILKAIKKFKNNLLIINQENN